MKLPKELFVKVDGTDREPFLNADDNLVALAEIGEACEVGIYKLEKTVTITGAVKIKGKK